MKNKKGIWPVKHRKRKTADSGEIFIKTTLRNLVLYIIYLGVLCTSKRNR